jgi:hypothetical protein
LAIASSAVVFGQSFNPQGQFSIAGSLPGDQAYPQAAISSAGGYLVWQDNAVTTKGLRINAVRLGANLSMSGSPFAVSAAVNSKTAGVQEKPQVALLNDGGAVIVWQGGKPGTQQILTRFVKADGTFASGDVRVSTARKCNQRDAQVATLTDGDLIIVWSSDGQDGSMQGVFARRFSSAGKPLGDEFQVNQFTLNNQRTPALVALANGNFAVAWVSELQRNSASLDIYARIFDSSGAALTPEFTLNTTTNNLCANPALAGSPQGGFAAAWSQNDNPVLTAGGSNIVVVSGVQTFRSVTDWDVYARLFDAAGTPTTDPFRLNQYTYGDQFAPRLASSGTNYMAIWTSLSQTNELGQVDPFEGVYGQFFTGSGVLMSTNDLHANATTLGRQKQSAVTADNAGRFLVVWSSVVPDIGRFDFDLFGQVYQ